MWEPHAIAGIEGAEVVSELKPEDEEFVIRKRRCSGFFRTDLGILLRELGVDTILLTVLDTSICVSHTAANAFYRGYALIVPKDAVTTFDQKDNDSTLAYMNKVYRAEMITIEELILWLDKTIRG